MESLTENKSKTLDFATKCLTEGQDLLICGGIACGKFNLSLIAAKQYAGEDNHLLLNWSLLDPRDFYSKLPFLEQNGEITWHESDILKGKMYDGKFVVVIDFDDITSINQLQETFLLKLLNKKGPECRVILCGLPELATNLPQWLTNRLLKIEVKN